MLRATQLSRTFGAAVPALDEVSFDVERGECVVLLGHNGAGKTTALRAVAGRLDLTGGEVLVDGHSPHSPASAPAARGLLSFVPDTPLLYDRLTVAEHVALVHAAHGASAGTDGDPAQPRARFSPDQALAELEVADLADRTPGTLSRGQRQRVQLACAVARPLDYLVLDEPVVGLDPRSQRILFELVQTLRDAGVGLLISTHQYGFAGAVGTRAIVLEAGRVAYAGSVEGGIEACSDLVPW